MARKPIEFDKESFVQLFGTIEASGTLEYCEKLALAYNTKHGTNIKPQMFYLRAKEWGLTFPKSQTRGRPTGSQGVKKPKKYKMDLKHWPKSQLEKYAKDIKKAEAGSYKYFIKVKCVDCSSFQQTEVRHCAVPTCPLYPIRPYRNKNETVCSED